MKAALGKAALVLMLPFLAIKAWLAKAKSWKKGEPMLPKTWYKAKVDGAKSSDGSPFYVYLKKSESKNLIVFFSGGGASWSQYTAARPMTVWSTIKGEDAFYFPSVKFYLEIMLSGILDKSNPKNPFDSWNAIYIPYATGDMHVGNREYEYKAKNGKTKILHHSGYANVKLCLDFASPLFPDTDKLLIAGESAGAFGCVALADLVASCWKTENVAIYSDSAQIWSSKWIDIVKDTWNAPETLSECITDDGELIADWFYRISKKLPNAWLLHSNSVFDDVLTPFQNKLNNDVYAVDQKALSEFNSHLKLSEQRLQSLKNYRRFVSSLGKSEKGTTPHTASRFNDRYLAKTPEGPSLAQWLEKACCQQKGFSDPGNVGDEHVK
jgi:hypothetical protein